MTIRIFGPSSGLLELLTDGVLRIVAELEFSNERPIHDVVRVLRVDRSGPVWRQVLVEGLLVLRAGLTVHGDDERLVVERQHVFAEVVRNELCRLCDTVVGGQEGGQAD